MEELIRFLTEYTEMFEKMEQKQVEKLGLLMMGGHDMEGCGIQEQEGGRQ